MGHSSLLISCTMATSTSTPLLRLLLLICFTLTFATTSTQDIPGYSPETAPETAFEASPGTEITIHKIPFLPLTLPFPLPTFLLDALKYLISLFKLESFLTVERTALRNGLFATPTTFLDAALLFFYMILFTGPAAPFVFFIFILFSVMGPAAPFVLLLFLLTILTGPVAPVGALLWLWANGFTVGDIGVL